MQEADLAISAAGQTLYELACIGCPTLALRVAANQEGQMRTMEQAGFLRVIGDAEQADVIPCLRESLLSLLDDANARGEMAAAGQQLVDGKGAIRVAKSIVLSVGEK